ncbi:MAG: porin family protein [Gallionella sp.]|nr:porin family protein [Gallionella sp.]
MLINSKVLAGALLLGVAVSPAMAESFYGALDFGQTKVKDACTDLPAGITGCKDTATLARIAGGYQFAPMWGAEISYGDYGKESAGTLLGVSVDWEARGWQISGTGTFPLGNAFSVIGKLGAARTELKLSGGGTSESATSTKLAFGIGAQYDFTRNFGLRAQYEDLGKVGDDNTTGTSKITLLSAGLVYKF